MKKILAGIELLLLGLFFTQLQTWYVYTKLGRWFIVIGVVVSVFGYLPFKRK